MIFAKCDGYIKKNPLFAWGGLNEQNNFIMIKLLIVDDSRTIRRSLAEMLELEGYVVTACETVVECKRLISRQKYDLILYSSSMKELNGHDFISFIDSKSLNLRCIMMIDKEMALDEVFLFAKENVAAIIEKPIVIPKLINTLRTILKDKNDEVTNIKKERKQPVYKTKIKAPIILGSSPQILNIKNTIDKISDSDARVLITGANGTGKELVAHCLHACSKRKTAPMIEVNCAAIPNDLIESALFGHEKGSFTSADTRYIGKFEQAEGGTLFLDEIGDMSLTAQAKVLRALQENKIGRVGGNKEIDVNVRIIAATNKNLRDEIARGNFREDLYHRLNVIPIHVPSLCERREDIPDLIAHFNMLFNDRYGRAPIVIAEDAMQNLVNKKWTGNIRELQNVVERLVVLCDGKVTLDDINIYCNECS